MRENPCNKSSHMPQLLTLRSRGNEDDDCSPPSVELLDFKGPEVAKQREVGASQYRCERATKRTGQTASNGTQSAKRTDSITEEENRSEKRQEDKKENRSEDRKGGQRLSKTDKRTPNSGEWRSQASECTQIVFAPKEQPADSSAAKES